VPCCYRGFGGIDNPNRSLDRFRDYLRRGVPTTSYELPSNKSNELGLRELCHRHFPPSIRALTTS
jgi:hypothetical protein